MSPLSLLINFLPVNNAHRNMKWSAAVSEVHANVLALLVL